MKTIIGILMCAAVCLGMAQSSFAATELQYTVGQAMETLHMDFVPNGVVGGPQRFRVTTKTVELLLRAVKEGKDIIVDSDGSIRFERARR